MVVRNLLREYGVRIVMAGDTHDLEYYLGARRRARPARETVHHFVNGGGGAYLSFGTSLAWPAQPATSQWAYYPNRHDVVEKIITDDALVEVAGVGVDAGARRLAFVARVAVGDVRLQRGAVLSELRGRDGGSGRTHADDPAVGDSRVRSRGRTSSARRR